MLATGGTSVFTQVTFRDVPVSDAVSVAAEKQAAKLKARCGWITGCRVVIGRPHHRGVQGSLYRVRIDLTMPRDEIVVNREHRFDHTHEDPYLALRAAFAAARRRLDEHLEQRRRAAKPRGEAHRVRRRSAVSTALT